MTKHIKVERNIYKTITSHGVQYIFASQILIYQAVLFFFHFIKLRYNSLFADIFQFILSLLIIPFYLVLYNLYRKFEKRYIYSRIGYARLAKPGLVPRSKGILITFGILGFLFLISFPFLIILPYVLGYRDIIPRLFMYTFILLFSVIPFMTARRYSVTRDYIFALVNLFIGLTIIFLVTNPRLAISIYLFVAGTVQFYYGLINFIEFLHNNPVIVEKEEDPADISNENQRVSKN
jgi:hypothetical protein